MSLTPMTPGKVRFRTNLPEVVLARHPFQLRRSGTEIARGARRGAPDSSNVFLLPGGAWSLQPFQGSLANLVTDDYAAAATDPDVDLNLAPNFLAVNTHRLPTDTELPGVGTPTTAGNIVRGFKKQRPITGGWDAGILTSDVAAVPQPPSSVLSPIIPIDRVASGRVTWGANDGAALMWEGLGNSFVSHTCFLNFYLGGNCDVFPTTQLGGSFCVSLIGDGSALLWELNHAPGGITTEDPSGTYWELRQRFKWGGDLLAGNLTNALYILPYARDHIAFISPKTFSAVGHVDLMSAGIPFAFQEPVSNQVDSFFAEAPIETGHIHTDSMTGPGVIRVDSRRDVRKVYSTARIQYPATGVLVDEPFILKGPLPAGTLLGVQLDQFLLPGTSITPQIYDGTTHAALTQDPFSGLWLTNAGQTSYYVVLTFHSSSSRFSTPILWGYVVECAGAQVGRSNTIITGGRIRNLNIQGAGVSCDTESANFELKDPKGEMVTLQQHDGQACDLVLVDDNEIIQSRLMEGVVNKPEANFRGGKQARLPNWTDYSVHIMSRSTRLAEQVPTDQFNFTSDPDFPELTWRVANVLRHCLYMAGAPADEIDIPVIYNSVRLWAPLERGNSTYALFPGGTQVYLRTAKRLCKEYFQAVLFRDANAGPRGMWRVLPNPGPIYGNPIAAFLQERPDLPGLRLGSVQGTWGSQQTFIRNSTYKCITERAEVNHVVVYGSGDEKGGTPTKIVWNELYNDVSHDFGLSITRSALANPDHPDWIGREVPLRVFDPTLWGQQAVDFTCRRIFDRAAHAWQRVIWQAPAISVVQAGDPFQTYPRPLHVNDTVVVQRKAPDLRMSLAVIRDVQIQVQRSDRVRWAWYEAQYVDH